MSHRLADNHAKRAPKNVIFFDTETREENVTATDKDLILKLGYAILTSRIARSGFNRVDECSFSDNLTFHRWISDITRKAGRYYIVAHNIGFDLRITGLTKYLTRNGWKRTSLIMEAANLMIRYRKDGATIFIMNNMQLFNSSLADLGESIGIPKLSVDFATVSDSDLLTYCKRDVEVMRQAWNLWYGFIQDNDLGNFQHTIGSQAMSAYRHRFMDVPIMIHTDERAIALERESYHGGRVECFRLGEQPKKKYYVLDVNSMYPYVMKNYPVPTKLLHYHERIGLKEFAKIRPDFGYIAEAHVTLERPVLPVVHEGRLIFPVGEISGVFTKPELEYALHTGALRSVRRVAVYAEESAFGSFVDFFYAARQRFKQEGNTQFAFFSKLILNSLYGKFGQKISEYEMVGENDSLGDQSGSTFSLSMGKEVKYRILDGIIEYETGEHEAHNAFPAIASYITGAARAYLTSLIDQAGWSHVLYCDTDSLFVDEVGYINLADRIDSGKLGCLKLENESDSVSIFGPKRYRFGDKERSKGIRKDATLVGVDTYSQEQFESFAGAIRSGNTDRVVIHTISKRLSDMYTKGEVSEDGTVTPFRFPLQSPHQA